MSAYLIQLMSYVNCLKSDACIYADRNLCRKEWILVVVQWILSCSPKASANAVTDNSKLFKIGDLFSNKGTNQDRTCYIREVLTRPTCDSSVG